MSRYYDGYLKLQAARRIRSARLSAARKLAKHTPEQWDALLDLVGRECLRCGADAYLKDHILPIYLGGSDGIENLQPLCRQCNSAKGPEAIDYRPENWASTFRYAK